MSGGGTRYKAVVIGSGAGGAPAATVLAEAWGDGVAVIEAGSHLKARDFNQLEREMVPRIYANGGTQGTDDGAVSVLQGQVVGGSTVINDALCFRPPPEIEERWKAYGVDVSLDALQPYVDRAWQMMGVTRIPKEMHNRANYLVGLGAARLGWKGERLHHNSIGCAQCGFRHLGCAYDAKQSMNLSFVPAAMRAGAQLMADTRVHHLVRDGTEWVVHTQNGEVRAEHVVVCAGIVQTPGILLRSGIPAGEGLQFHMQTSAWGEFADPVDPHNGIPMSYGVLEFGDVYGHTGPGFVIEGVAVQPLAFSTYPQLQGAAHEEVLRRYRHMAGALPLVRSKARGRITLDGERPAIDYPLVPEDAVRLGQFYEKATELFLAAGATRVLLTHRKQGWVDKVTPAPEMTRGDFHLYTAHPFGGANRGTTTDGVGRVKDQQNLWVLDASAIPEALGVNPQVTIAALALEGATRLVSEA